MKWLAAGIVFVLFTLMGCLIGALFSHPLLGAGIGFLIPVIWLSVVTVFFLFMGLSLQKFFNGVGSKPDRPWRVL